MNNDRDEHVFDFAVSDKESRTFKVMVFFILFAVALLIIVSIDSVRSSFSYWEYIRCYSAGMLIASLVAIIFIWFVNTSGLMVSVSSYSMFIVTVCGFGIILVSIIQYVILPNFFNEMALMFGLGLSTIVFALGI